MLVLIIGSAVWYRLSSSNSDNVSRSNAEASLPPMKDLPFTSFPGVEEAPTFAPDGNEIAFSWGGEKGDNFDIYIMLLGSGRPMRLTTDPAYDTNPAWAPDGRQITFIRKSETELAIFSVPALGGAERKLLSLGPRTDWGAGIPSLAWTPDGEYIACTEKRGQREPFDIFLLSPETGERRTPTSPPARF